MPLPKIYLVDDHLLFRNGIKMLIEHFGTGKVIGEAANGRMFLDDLEQNVPDIVFMNIDMLEMNNIEATELALKMNLEL